VRIHQVLVGAREGDAITQIALNLRSVLNRFGGSEVFARHVDPSVGGHVRPIDQLVPECGPSDVVILHVSIGDDIVWDAVAATPGRVWVSYHNITPSQFFSLDPDFAAHLDQGRRQLLELAPRIERIFTESEYNRQDLMSMGFDDVVVLPGFLDPDRLAGLPSDPHFGRKLHDRAPAEMILFVGQLLPHKRPDLLVAAHHLLITHHRPMATLVLVGHHPSARFAGQVAAFVDSLGLADRVWIAGGVTDSQLGELYRRADVLATASQHEGLCLPVVEAMAMSVPVVVSDHGALPETVARSGVVVTCDTPEGFAEGIDLALEPSRRAELVLRGRARARAMSLERSAAAAASAVAGWIDRSA